MISVTYVFSLIYTFCLTQSILSQIYTKKSTSEKKLFNNMSQVFLSKLWRETFLRLFLTVHRTSLDSFTIIHKAYKSVVDEAAKKSFLTLVLSE